ncbi:MAG: hypothetical protein JNK48_23150 [Bryobacterales bacterium]|nr:hypothetical protein [Bryobacterales bacterium]
MTPALLALLMAGVLYAQDKPAQEPAKEAPKEAAAEAAKEAPKEEAKPEAAADAAAVERMFEIDLEVGTRWQQNVLGNRDTYRSVVNLGEGVRIMNWDARFHKDEWVATSRGAGWGGDPSEWLNFQFERRKYFRFNADHRNTAYFNALPSFANPLLDRGIYANQRAFDTNRRLTDLQVDFLPGGKFIPFFGYMRDRGFGRGTSLFVADSNEYPVLTNLNDRTNLYRGGLRVEMKRFHATLEQGGIQFNDDQNLVNAGAIAGNRPNPILGQSLFLNNLLQAYAVDGSSIYTKALMTAQPVGWLDVSGGLQYSRPRNDVVYSQQNDGRFVDLDSLLFFNTQSVRLLSAASQPHTTGNLGLELRPFSSFRVMSSFVTDRLKNEPTLGGSPLAERLEWNYNQHQTEAVFEPVTRLTLRGGYRYVWGDGLSRSGQLSPTPAERTELKRHVGLAGAGFRVTDKASLNADVEIARSDRVMFRTSLTDYERVRMRGRYQLLTHLRLYGTVQILNNTNPPVFNRFEFRSHQTALGLQWMPGGGNTVQMTGEYSRAAVKSEMDYLIPQVLQSTLSHYRENTHTLTGMVQWRMAVGWTWQPTLSAGGSMYLTSGTRPTDYYQPMVRLNTPVYSHLDLFAEYRWYGLSQQIYRFEGFRTHQGAVGIRIH